MKRFKAPLGASVVAMVIAIQFMPLLLVLTLLLACALSCVVLFRVLYRPPENHVAAIYHFDRPWQLLGPDEWVLAWPILYKIRFEISLSHRRVQIRLSNLLTRDNVPFDCDVFVQYQVDPREANPRYLSEVLRIAGKSWDDIVGATLQEIAGEVFSAANVSDLLSATGRRRLKRALGQELAMRVHSLGLTVRPSTGVSIQGLLPAPELRDAMADHSAAADLGEAAVGRFAPIIRELAAHPELTARDVQLLARAASLVRKGSQPEVIVAVEDGLGGDGQDPPPAVEPQPDGRGPMDSVMLRNILRAAAALGAQDDKLT